MMDNEIEKNGRAGNSRPFKMNNWLPKLKLVLENEDWVFLTDEELVFLVNSKLKPEEQICQSTFEKWKSGKYAPDETIAKEFANAIKLALIRQKQMLGQRMFSETAGNWQKVSWILERKWSDLNLKKISENINKNEQSTVIHITAGNEQQKALIESIMNIDFVEIPPKRIESNDNEKEDEYDF